jgi:glycosyltransferase involved in cell wall biosynthesis
MRILQVLTYYSPYVSGLTVYAQRLGTGLAAAGHDVSVVAYRHEPSLPLQERLEEVEVHRVPVQLRLAKGVLGAGFLSDAGRRAREADAVILHLPCLEAGWVSRRIPQKKLVAVYHCDLVLRDRWWQRPIESVVRGSAAQAVRRAARVVASSRGYAEASPILRTALEKLEVIPPPILDGAFRPVDRTATRKRLGIPAAAPVVGFLGRFVSEKGLPVLLDAVPRLAQRLPEVRIVLAGEQRLVAGGTVTDALQERLRALGDRVILPGFVPQEELPAFYSMLDCFVLPSLSAMESFGMVQVEALLCGTPVVASDLPGVRDVIERLGVGRLAAPGDAGSLSGAILEVLTQPERHQVDRQRVLASFGFSQTIRRFEALLQRREAATVT